MEQDGIVSVWAGFFEDEASLMAFAAEEGYVSEGNKNVSLYNQRIHTFPYLLLAKLHGMKEAKFYTVEEKKKDFKVQF